MRIGRSIAAISTIAMVLIFILILVQKSEGTNMQSKMVKANSIELYTESFGDQKNPAVLLIAGTATSARYWFDGFCRQLADAGYFVIRYDHRDIGLSSTVDCSQAPYAMSDLTSDAVAVLDAYGIKKAHVVGHSMGGAIAQLLALDYPTRVLSATPISTMVLTPFEFTDEEKAVQAKLFPVIMNNRPTQHYEESLTRWLTAFAYFHGDTPIERDIAQTYVKDMYTRTKPIYLERLGAGQLHNHMLAHRSIVDRTKDLKKISVPVCFIHGEKDCLIPKRVVEMYGVAPCSQATLQVVQGMGHMLMNRSLFEAVGKMLIKQFAR